jgi:hypothetical protein
MTGQLRTTFQDRADQLGMPEIDLDAIVHEGERRVRRRRTALAGAVAALLVAAGGATAIAVGGHDATRVGPADPSAKPLTYAVGSVIHTGDGTIDVGRKVESMVQTRWGFVFTTPNHQVFSEQDGVVHPIGSIPADGKLVASDDGWVTAWWDGHNLQTWPGYGSGEPGPTVNFDRTLPRGETVDWPSGSPPRVEAVSDGHIWLWDGHHHWIEETLPSTTHAIWNDTNSPGAGTVVDAAGDQVLVKTDSGMTVTTANLLPEPLSRQDGWTPGGDLTNLPTQVPNLDTGDLAPDGKHWFTDENDQFAVFDSATGQREDPAHPGFAFADPYQWLDGDTMAAIGLEGTSGNDPVSLLTCHVSTDECQVTVPDVGHYGDFAVPVGEVIAGH